MLPDYFELETQRSKLAESTLNTSSYTLRVFQYYRFFSTVLAYSDKNTEEAFLREFLGDYIFVLAKFSVHGVEPAFSENLITHLQELNRRHLTQDYRPVLNEIITRLEQEYNTLSQVLAGKMQYIQTEPKAFFPLIDQKNKEGFYGILESVIVRISKAQSKNSFIIIPSEREIEKRIAEQCEISWQLALSKLHSFIKKPAKFHEVIISFERKEGIYEGNSLGIALTISFLESLLNHYNPVYTIRVEPGIAFSGAVTGKGEVKFPGDEIIRQKTAALFYSPINTFVYPKSSEAAAEQAYRSLQQKYPKRELKLVPVGSFDDILNRRDLVEIRKRNIAKRAGRFIKTNWVAAASVFLSLLVAFMLLVADFDNNPKELATDGTLLFVKNRNGKILWTKGIGFDTRQILSGSMISRYARIVDIDSDGENEVLISNELDPKTHNPIDNSLLTCYDKNEKVIWTYSLHDKVSSRREVLNTQYGMNILDTLTFAGRKSLFLFSANGPSFSSAVYRIDLRTGRRLPGTLWASGHIMDCCIMDPDKDGRPEIIGAGYDNGYEDLVFFAFNIDTITQVRPTTEEYLIKGFPLCKMKAYLRFPKNDFDEYMKVRTPSYLAEGFLVNAKNRIFQFGSAIPYENVDFETSYEIGFNFKNVEVNFSSTFRVQRDTLVAHGILKPPYTDTKEYRNIIKNQILYWNNGVWQRKEALTSALLHSYPLTSRARTVILFRPLF